MPHDAREASPHDDVAFSRFHELLGLSLLDWADGFARVACEVGPQHHNRSGIAHGGLILSMIDQAGAFAGLYCTVPGNVRRAVTVDLDCRFTGQVVAGRLIAEGRIASGGRSLFFVRTEVMDASGKVVAFGASTHRWRKGSENPEGIAP